GECPYPFCFFSSKGLDRSPLLNTLLCNFARQNLPATPDSGWERYDLEIVGSPWTHSTLTTASEYLDEGKIFLRCRLKAKWSALAIIVFSLLLGVELLLINHLAQSVPWL